MTGFLCSARFFTKQFYFRRWDKRVDYRIRMVDAAAKYQWQSHERGSYLADANTRSG